MIMRLAPLPYSWMRLVKNSNTEVSGASEVPQSRDKLVFKTQKLILDDLDQS